MARGRRADIRHDNKHFCKLTPLTSTCNAPKTQHVTQTHCNYTRKLKLLDESCWTFIEKTCEMVLLLKKSLLLMNLLYIVLYVLFYNEASILPIYTWEQDSSLCCLIQDKDYILYTTIKTIYYISSYIYKQTQLPLHQTKPTVKPMIAILRQWLFIVSMNACYIRRTLDSPTPVTELGLRLVIWGVRLAS